jgi:hypothetical protein
VWGAPERVRFNKWRRETFVTDDPIDFGYSAVSAVCVACVSDQRFERFPQF